MPVGFAPHRYCRNDRIGPSIDDGHIVAIAVGNVDQVGRRIHSKKDGVSSNLDRRDVVRVEPSIAVTVPLYKLAT